MIKIEPSIHLPHIKKYTLQEGRFSIMFFLNISTLRHIKLEINIVSKNV